MVSAWAQFAVDHFTDRMWTVTTAYDTLAISGCFIDALETVPYGSKGLKPIITGETPRIDSNIGEFSTYQSPSGMLTIFGLKQYV